MSMMQTATHSYAGVRRPVLSGMGAMLAQRAGVRTGTIGELGDAAPTAAQAQQISTTLQTQLGQAGQDLQALANAAASNATVGAAIQVSLNAANQQYSALAAQVTAWLNANSGLWNALGLALNLPAALNLIHQGATYISQLEQLQNSITAMKSQLVSLAGQNTAITQGSATNYAALAATAYANGDSAMGDYYSALAQEAQTIAMNQSASQAPQPLPPAAPPDFMTWLETNAVWIGLGVLAFVTFPPLIKKL
jgi:hypothetical protein